MTKWLLLLWLLLPLAAGAQARSGLQPYSGPPYNCVNTFGDSITDGVGSTTVRSGGAGAAGYAWQIINAYGGCGTNFGFSGDQAGDMAIKVLADAAPTVQGNPLTTMMVSTNDYDNYGTTAALETIFQGALEAAIAWAAIPDVAKLSLYSSPACTFTGAWSQVAQTGAGYPSYSGDITSGDSATCTLTTYGSGPIYIAYTLLETGVVGTTQSFTVSVDGGSAVTFNEIPTTSTVTTLNGNTYFPVLGRIAGPFSAGTHTVVITNSTTGGYMSVYFLGAPYPTAPGANTPPAVFVGGTPWESTNTNSTLVSAYNTLIQSAVSLLAGDGLPVTFVNVEASLNTTTDFAGGTLANGYVCPASGNLPLHPGNCGHTHLAQSFLNVLPSAFHAGPIPGNQLYYGPARTGSGWIYGSVNTWQSGGNPLPPPGASSVQLTASTSIASTSYTSTGLVLPYAPPYVTWHGRCSLIYEQATAVSTVGFGVGLSAAPTDLWVMNTLSTGAGGVTKTDLYTTIASTTTTAISASAAPSAINTAYKDEIDFTLETGANFVQATIYGKSGSGSDALVIEPGSYCGWLQ